MLNGVCHPPVCEFGDERRCQPHCVSPWTAPWWGLSPDPAFQPPPPPSIPSPTWLWVSLELGDTASGMGLDGLSDTELDRGSPPFSWGEQGGSVSSSPGA